MAASGVAVRAPRRARRRGPGSAASRGGAPPSSRRRARGAGQPVGLAIGLDDPRVVDGDVGGALVEVVDRIAAVLHDGLDQHVRLSRGPFRIVDEARLHALPLADVALSRSGRERRDLELSAALGAGRELGLGLALALRVVERSGRTRGRTGRAEPASGGLPALARRRAPRRRRRRLRSVPMPNQAFRSSFGGFLRWNGEAALRVAA